MKKQTIQQIISFLRGLFFGHDGPLLPPMWLVISITMIGLVIRIVFNVFNNN